MSITAEGYAVRYAPCPLHHAIEALADRHLPFTRRSLSYNKTKKGLELLRRQGTLALLQAAPQPDRDEDEDEEDGPLEGLAQLRDVVKVLRRLASKAR